VRNDAPLILSEWAERVNDETRAFMGVVVGKLPAYSPPPNKFHCARREARVYLDGLLSGEEAAACVQADVERVRAMRERDAAWSAAARDYHKDRGNKVSLVEYTPAQLARLNRLLDSSLSLDRLYNELLQDRELPKSNIDAVEYLIRSGDAGQLRKFLAAHSASERAAIREHFERKGKLAA